MINEIISGECPCCGYNKLYLRIGNPTDYFLADMCPRCGLAKVSNTEFDDLSNDELWEALATHFKHIYGLKNGSRKNVFMYYESSDVVRSNDVSSTSQTFSDQEILEFRAIKKL